jgi:ankyrin repeat protein
MSLTVLSPELLLTIAEQLVDPCDIKSLLRVNHRFYDLISGLFTKRFSHLAAGSANIIDIRKTDLKNWQQYSPSDDYRFWKRFSKDPSLSWSQYARSTIMFSDDPGVIDERKRYLELCNLAYYGTLQEWNRLVRALVRRGVPGDATVLVPPLDVDIDPDNMIIRGSISILIEAVRQNNIELVRFLLEAGTNVNLRCYCFNEYDITPLILASVCGLQ